MGTDQFYINLYNYYFKKGFINIILNEFYNLFQLLFVYIVINTTIIKPYSFIFFLVLITFLMYLLPSIYGSWITIINYYNIKSFYSHLNVDDLIHTEWGNIANNIINSFKNSIRSDDDSDLINSELDLVNRIMRKENYLIGMINDGILDINFLNLTTLLDTKSLEWILSFTIFSNLFRGDQPYILYNPNRTKLIEELKSNIKISAIVSLFLAPIIWIYLVIHTTLKYAQNKPSVLITKKWSNGAIWKFREFNELPHSLTERLDVASSYVGLLMGFYETPIITNFMNFVTFVASGIATVLILLSIFSTSSSSILFGQTFVWWISICSTIILVGNISGMGVCNNYTPKECIEKIKLYTHDENLDIKSINKYYKYKFEIVIQELLCILLMPYIIYYLILPKSQLFVDFIYSNTKTINSSSICSYSNFELTSIDSKKITKIEKSMLHFKAIHDKWEIGDIEKNLIISLMKTAEGECDYDSVLSRSTFLIKAHDKKNKSN